MPRSLQPVATGLTAQLQRLRVPIHQWSSMESAKQWIVIHFFVSAGRFLQFHDLDFQVYVRVAHNLSVRERPILLLHKFESVYGADGAVRCQLELLLNRRKDARKLKGIVLWEKETMIWN